MVHNCLVKILLLESRKNLVGIIKDLFRWLYTDWKTLQVKWLQLDSNPQPLISYLEISGKFFISSASYFFVSKWKSVQFGVLSFVGYLMERVIACLCLERFNFTNFHLPFSLLCTFFRCNCLWYQIRMIITIITVTSTFCC